MVRILAGLVCHLLVCCCLAVAQDRSPPAAPQTDPIPDTKPSEPASLKVDESRPSEFYLRDKHGTLQRVLGFSYEEFEELYRLKQQLAQPQRQPRYAIARIAVTGTAQAGHAELTVEIGVRVAEEDWVRVPLRLDNAVLRQVVYAGEGEQFVHFEGEGKGYVSWIRGKAGGQHRLTLSVLAPLSAAGRETVLKLSLPQAACELKLTVPLPGAVGRVSEDAILEPPSQAGDDTTELRVIGRGGDFQLAWRPADGPVADSPTVLEATGAIFVRIDSHSIDTEAVLEVRSQGAPFDHFRVRLPKRAELAPGAPSLYTVVPVDDPAESAPNRPVVEVRLPKEESGPVQVRLATRQSHSVGKEDEWFEPAGFEVLGAARQWGHVAAATVGDWHVRWRLGRQLPQIEEGRLPQIEEGQLRQIEVGRLPEALRQQGVVAAFEYFAQPCWLSGQALLRRTRINVEPVYLLMVDAHEVRLKADLNYTISGAKAFQLDVAMPPGWEIVDVGPGSLVAVDGVAIYESNVLSVRLAEAAIGRVNLQLHARWPISPGTDSLVLPLPQPAVSYPATSVVVVAPADNVELTPDDKDMAGLDRQQIDPPIERPSDRQQVPLYYRGEGGKDMFEAGFGVHTQRITVEASGQVRLEPPLAQVEQKLTYTIQHQRASHLMLDVPRSLADPGKLELLHDGRPLLPRVVLPDGDGQGGEDDASGPVRMRITLPQPCIGQCELVARHSVEFQKLLSGEPLPLVMPGDDELTGNELEASAPAEISLQPRGTVWKAQETGTSPEEQSVLRLAADGHTDRLELTIEHQAGKDDRQEATVVHRAWVQTWLTEDFRQDRAVFSFTSNRRELRLVVPAEATVGQIELDGRQVRQFTAQDGRLIVRLPEDTEHHTLELRCHLDRPRPPRGRLSIEIPQLGDDVWVRRLYWQLVLPPNEHVIVNPSGFTSEFDWGFNGYFWGREPLMDQSQLETWVGVAGETFSSAGVNCYLFSSVGEVKSCRLRTASRTSIVLFSSGGALVIGLMLIFFPASRHPGVLLSAAIVLFAAGLIYPGPALLAAQAAGLGLALTLLAGLLQRSVARRGADTMETPGSHLEKGSTQAQYRPPAAGNQISTQTAPPAAGTLPPDSDA